MAATSDRLKDDMQRVLHHMHAELDRVELLAAALGAFNAPVPDYEPGFRHMRELRAYEIDGPISGERQRRDVKSADSPG